MLPDLFSRAWWGAVGAMAAVFVPTLLYLWSERTARHSRRLSYSVEKTPYTSMNLDPLPIEVSYDGQPVENVWTIRLQIRNSGKLPIRAEDFAEPLSVRVLEAKVLATAIGQNATPKSVKPKLMESPDSDVQKIAPLLLNPGDAFRMWILVHAGEPVVNVEARIVAGNDPQLENPMTSVRETIVTRAILSVAFGWMMGLIALLSYGPDLKGNDLLLITIALVSAAAGVAYPSMIKSIVDSYLRIWRRRRRVLE